MEPVGRYSNTSFVWGPHFSVYSRATNKYNYISLLLARKKTYISRLTYLNCSLIIIISYFERIYTLYRETYFDFSQGPGYIPIITKHLLAFHLALISRVNLKLETHP